MKKMIKKEFERKKKRIKSKWTYRQVIIQGNWTNVHVSTVQRFEIIYTATYS